MPVFTKQDLKQYVGTSEEPRLYLSIMGDVFDVSSKTDIYGKQPDEFRTDLLG